MTETPVWILTISYWLHMIATVGWVGSQAIISLVVVPLSRKNHTAIHHHKLLSDINKRMSTLGWIGLSALIVTGLVQLTANENYTGLVSIANNWSVAILIKHIAFILILGLSAYQTWSLMPAFERTSLLQLKGKSTPEEQAALQKRVEWILRGNIFLSAIVLLLTAIARIS